MYCHACGIALTQPTKFCNRCGVQLVTASSGRKDKTPAEKQLNDYLDGLFWITVFGLGFIIGGAVLLKKADFRDLTILVYTVISSILFLINFSLSLWTALRLMRITKEERKLTVQPGPETAELNPARPEIFLKPANSVTENTTRSFEHVPGINRSGSE
jgi:hypothetical protein